MKINFNIVLVSVSDFLLDCETPHALCPKHHALLKVMTCSTDTHEIGSGIVVR